MSLLTTPSQTIGPYLYIGLAPLSIDAIAPPDAGGERLTIEGRVVDGEAKPVSDAVIEIWQADAAGKYPDGSAANRVAGRFRGFGRIMTGDEGAFRFTTIKPGPVPGPGGEMQAPHLVVTVFMRGLLKQLMTRIYFPDEPGNDADPILRMVPDKRRHTLVARRAPPASSPLHWDLVLQGEAETVFFDL